MKARIKATGEIVDGNAMVYFNGDDFYLDELEAIIDETEKIYDELDEVYWKNLEHQYAGMAMQGILTNPIGFENIRARGTNIQIETALLASEFAHALIQKLKEKEKNNE